MTELHVTAGPKALAAVSRWLGLELDGLCALGRGEPRLRLSVRAATREIVVFASAAPSGGLSLELDGRAGASSARLLERLETRLGPRKVADFVAAIEADPLSFSEEVDPERSGDAVKVPCIGQPLPLLEAGWRNFYADQDFEVLLGVPSCTSRDTINVEYADLECYYSRPKRDHLKWTFLDWPEESDDDIHGDPRKEGGTESNIVTELDERDMILGTGERADALVDELRRRAKPGSYLLFTHLCTPIIMGEDFNGLAKRCEKEVSGTAVRWSQKDRDDNDNFGEHFRALLGRPGFFDAPDDPLAVNLFHFPKRCRRSDVIPFLRSLGLSVNVSVLPDVSLPDLERIPSARWQVFCERSSYPTKLRELLAASPRTVVSARAPYGVDGTRECLRAIALAAGKDGGFEEAWAAFFEPQRRDWETMREEAAGYRLAFGVSEATLPRLVSLRYGHGAPLATMAREMGFGVDLVYYDLHGRPPALPAGLEDARVSTFRSPWELSRALEVGDFHAVYSDVFFDWRVSRAGKARFAGKDFQMGARGAVETLEKLLAVCRTSFYRRYAGHLRAGEASRGR